MFETDGNIIMNQSAQFTNISNVIGNIANDILNECQKESPDIGILKAYIASIDVQMDGANAQKILLQSAIDTLASKLAG